MLIHSEISARKNDTSRNGEFTCETPADDRAAQCSSGAPTASRVIESECCPRGAARDALADMIKVWMITGILTSSFLCVNDEILDILLDRLLTTSKSRAIRVLRSLYYGWLNSWAMHLLRFYESSSDHYFNL